MAIGSSKQETISKVLRYGYDCYDEISKDPNHRYLSWEYCHEAFKQHRQKQDDKSFGDLTEKMGYGHDKL